MLSLNTQLYKQCYLMAEHKQVKWLVRLKTSHRIVTACCDSVGKEPPLL